IMHDAFITRLSFLALAAALAGAATAQDADQDAPPEQADKRKDATEATKAANAALREELPFGDRTDFESARRGRIAPLPDELIKGDDGNLIWDPKKYRFIQLGSETPETVNPSLWRQSQLLNVSGLFEVTDGIYQVRNLDLSNMTIIEGKEGITIVDPLVSVETA